MLRTWTLLILLILAAQGELRAQSSGSFGSRTTGSTISGGSRSLSGSRSSAPSLDQQAQAGQVSGNERFVRGARQPGQFVGADTADATNPFSIAQQGGNNPFQQFSNFARQSQQFQAQNARNATGNNRQLRIPISLGFEKAPRVAAQASLNMAQRLERLPGLHRTGPLTVQWDGATALLRGSVATEHDRVLAEQLVRLEPGVNAVRNELQVVPAETLPAPEDSSPR